MIMPKRTARTAFVNTFDSKLIVLIILACVGTLIYCNTIHSPFAFDDNGVIVDSKYIKSNEPFANVFQPRYLGIISFALNYKINKLDTFGYHLVNIIIHLLNAFLVYLIFRQLAILSSHKILSENNSLIAFFIALLFLVHPIQTQAVTYIVQRFTSLAALFAYLSLYCFIKFRLSVPVKYSYYVVSLFSALCAYKTKENTATLPLLLLVAELLFFNNSTDSRKRRVLYLIPFLLLMLVIPLSFIHIDKSIADLMGEVKEKSYETRTVTRMEYLLTEQRVIVTYMRLLILPVKQSIDYYFPLSHSLFEAKTLFSFIFLIFLFIYALFVSRKHVLFAFGVLWFFIFLLVESSVVPITDVIFEHRIYLSSAGFIAAFVSIVFYFLGQSKRTLALSIITIIAIILSFAAFKRNEVWKEGISLWRDAASKYPSNLRCHLNYGCALAESEKFDDAIQEIELVFRLDPDNINYYYIKGHTNLAFCYFRKGMMDLALKEYNIVLQLEPKNPKNYGFLATISMEKGDLNEALRLLRKGQSIDNTDSMINGMLGDIYCQQGDLNTSLNYFTKALEKEPDFLNGHLYLAFCYLRHNMMNDARTHFLRVTQLKTDFSDPYYYIAVSYDKEGNYQKAREFYQQFISQSSPDNPLIPDAQTRLK